MSLRVLMLFSVALVSPSFIFTKQTNIESGTTRANVENQEQYRKIDYGLPLQAANFSKEFKVCLLPNSQ